MALTSRGSESAARVPWTSPIARESRLSRVVFVMMSGRRNGDEMGPWLENSQLERLFAPTQDGESCASNPKSLALRSCVTIAVLDTFYGQCNHRSS